MSRISNSLKNIISGLGLKILLLILRFATRTIFIKYLGSEYLGVNGLVSSILSFLNITDLGIGTALVFAMYKPIDEKNEEKVRQYLAYYKRIYDLLGLVVLAFGLAIMPFLQFMVNEKTLMVNIYMVYILYLAGSVSSFYVYTYRGGFISACQQEYRLAISNYVTNICVVAFQILALVLFRSFYLYIALPILAMVIQRTVNGIFIAKWHPYIKEPPRGKLDKEEKKAIYKNTYGLAISKISAIANNAIGNIVISSMIGLVYVGLYSNYQILIVMVSGFVEILFSSLNASVGNLHVNATDEYKEHIFNVINFMSFWLYALCAICFLNLVQPFIVLWIGSEYLMSISLVVAVCLNFLTGGMNSAVNIYRESCGLYYQGRYRPVFTALCNVLLSILLGWKWGAAGVVCAAIISRMLTIWWYDAYIVFKHVFHKGTVGYLMDYLWRIVLVGMVGAMTYVICNSFNFNILINLGLRLLISLSLVNLAFFLLFFKTKEFHYMRNLVRAVCSRALGHCNP